MRKFKDPGKESLMKRARIFFVLHPRSRYAKDPKAISSRRALLTYAINIRESNEKLADELTEWCIEEAIYEKKLIEKK